MQVMRIVLCAVWQESVNTCPTFQKYYVSVIWSLVEAYQSTCPVSKLLVGLLQEPIEVLSGVWQQLVSPIVPPCPVGAPEALSRYMESGRSLSVQLLPLFIF